MPFQGNSKKEKPHQDKDFVRRILNGDEQTWAEFVEHYTDWVFNRAFHWTKRALFTSKWRTIAVIKNKQTGKKTKYPEETHDAYLWLFIQLRDNKLKYYTGNLGVTLDDYIWTVIHSPNLFKDYLRWKHGDPRKIPKILQDAPEEEKEVFVLMRKAKSIEQIASKLQISYEEAEAIASRVIKKLNKAGLGDLVLPRIKIEYDDEASQPPEPAKYTKEDRILLYKVYAAYCSAVNELQADEKLLLKLFYNLDLTSKEVLENYKAADMPRPGGRHPKEAQPNDIFKIKYKIENKLLEFFRKHCESIPEVVINEKTLKAFLEQFGVECNEKQLHH